MTVEYGPFDTLPDGTTAAEYTEDQGSVLFGGAIGDGVACMPDDGAWVPTRVSDSSGVNFAPGVCFAQGFFSRITSTETVAVDPADASDRIDRLVARLDRSANTFVPYVHKGTAGSATPPALERTDDVWEVRIGRAVRGADGSLTVYEERDYAPVAIYPTTSNNQPAADGRIAFEWQHDTKKLIRRDPDGSRATLLETSGPVNVSPTGLWKVSTGFANSAERLNGWVTLTLRLDRTTNTLHTTDANGSPLVASGAIPAAYRPSVARYGYANMGGGRSGVVQVTAAGAATLFSISGDIPVGAGLRADIVYPGA